MAFSQSAAIDCAAPLRVPLRLLLHLLLLSHLPNFFGEL